MKAHLHRFFLGSSWGWLALTSLLLQPVSGSVFGFKAYTIEAIILLISWLLSLTGLLFLFIYRDTLWINELAGRVKPGFQVGLLPIGGVGFLAFVGVGSMVAAAWGVTAWSGERPAFTELPLWGTSLMGLVFTGQGVAAGIYSVCAYGRWLARIAPEPIFLDETHLLQLIQQAATPRIVTETSLDKAVTILLVNCSRTEQAGLSLKIRVETTTDKVWDGRFLKAVQPWRVVSDRWGQVQLCCHDGPLEYIFDPERLYSPFAPSYPDLLEGELIFPEKSSLPTIEEAILMAFASDP